MSDLRTLLAALGVSQQGACQLTLPEDMINGELRNLKFQYKQTIIFLAYVSVPLPSTPNKIILPEAKQSGCEIEKV